MKSKIMKRAHQIAKTLIGDYYARLALALRQAWREAKTMIKITLTPEQRTIVETEYRRMVRRGKYEMVPGHVTLTKAIADDAEQLQQFGMLNEKCTAEYANGTLTVNTQNSRITTERVQELVNIYVPSITKERGGII